MAQKMTDKLSISDRYILTYIAYKTNHNHIFFAGNEAIARVIGLEVSSTKVLVNKLIRNGYLTKNYDKKKRRILTLSGRPFLPLDGVNMSNTEKNLLKEDAKDQERWADYEKQQRKEKEAENERLRQELCKIRMENLRLEQEILRLKDELALLQKTDEPSTAEPMINPDDPTPEPTAYKSDTTTLTSSFDIETILAQLRGEIPYDTNLAR